MDKKLTELADSIASAHDVLDEIVEHARRRGGPLGAWRAGMAEEPPETVFEGKGAVETDSMIVRELSDEAAATYVLRELWEKGFAVEADEDDHGRFVFAVRGAPGAAN